MADTQHEDHGSHGEDHSHEHGSTQLFIGVFIGLCILTALSFAAGSSSFVMSTPSIGWTIMITVSVCKALLVMLYFMHLKWEANWKYVLTIPATMMSLFLIFALVPDIGLRTLSYTAERWLYAPSPRVEAHDHASGDHDHADNGEHEDENADH